MTASAVMRASATLTATAPMPPIVTRITSTTARFALVDETVTPAAPAVRLPSTEAVVPPLMVAEGTDTATPKSPPPAPMPVETRASLPLVAVKEIEPVLEIDWLLFPSLESASTSAPLPMSADSTLAAIPAAADTATTIPSALARFLPVALTATEAELVTFPSRIACTAPPM